MRAKLVDTEGPDFGPKVQRPCDCGCDERDGPTTGYLHMARNGTVMVINAETEDEYLELLKLFD